MLEHIVRIVVIQRHHHMDLIRLHTDLPSTTMLEDGPLVLEFEAAQGTGVDYCHKVFQVPISDIDVLQG